MKSIIQFSSFILLLQSCSSSSNNEFVNLVNDILVEKEAFVEKTMYSSPFSEDLTQQETDIKYATLIEANNIFWDKVEIISDTQSISILQKDFIYDDKIKKLAFHFPTNSNQRITFRYHGINTVFDTSMMVFENDIIEPPYSLIDIYNNYDFIYNFSSLALKNKESNHKYNKIPERLLTPSDIDTTYIIIHNSSCDVNYLTYYKYYINNDTIFFENNSNSQANSTKLKSKFNFEEFRKILQDFKRDAYVESNTFTYSSESFLVIKNREIARLTYLDPEIDVISNFLIAMGMIEKEVL